MIVTQAFLVIPAWEERRRVQEGMPRHFFGTRHAPIAATPWGVPPVTAKQEHGNHVIILPAPSPEPSPSQGEGEVRGDALVTGRAGATIGVLTADCLPILLADPGRGLVAAVHAGWRGSLLRIAQKGVETMVKAFGSLPADIMAALGPAIGRCCYEVGPEVLEPLRREFPYWPDLVNDPAPRAAKTALDLRAWNRRQLEEIGVRQIDDLALCTACHPELFFSFRRDGQGIVRRGQSGSQNTMLSGITAGERPSFVTGEGGVRGEG